MNDKNIKKDPLIRSNHFFLQSQLNWMAKNRKKTGTSSGELLRRLLNEYIKSQEKTI